MAVKLTTPPGGVHEGGGRIGRQVRRRDPGCRWGRGRRRWAHVGGGGGGHASADLRSRGPRRGRRRGIRRGRRPRRPRWSSRPSTALPVLPRREQRGPAIRCPHHNSPSTLGRLSLAKARPRRTNRPCGLRPQGGMQRVDRVGRSGAGTAGGFRTTMRPVNRSSRRVRAADHRVGDRGTPGAPGVQERCGHRLARTRAPAAACSAPT